MNEKELWKDLKRGSKTALEKIYRRFFSELISYSRRFTHREDIIEDSIQELFIELWKRREGLSDLDKIKPYLLVSIRRKVISKLKKLNKKDGGTVEEGHFAAGLTIEQELVSQEINNDNNKRLREALDQLSERQREIIYLKFYANLEYSEIAEIMDLNYQSARNLVSRAIKKIGKIMIFILAMAFFYVDQQCFLIN